MERVLTPAARLRGALRRDCCRQPDAGVGGAENMIVPPLDDLEEEALVEDLGVDLEELAVALAVVEDVVGA